MTEVGVSQDNCVSEMSLNSSISHYERMMNIFSTPDVTSPVSTMSDSSDRRMLLWVETSLDITRVRIFRIVKISALQWGPSISLITAICGLIKTKRIVTPEQHLHHSLLGLLLQMFCKRRDAHIRRHRVQHLYTASIQPIACKSRDSGQESLN